MVCVNSKKNEVYIWLAIDRNSRKIVGFVGDRTRKSARGLLYQVYQQCAIAYTDFLQTQNSLFLTIVIVLL